MYDNDDGTFDDDPTAVGAANGAEPVNNLLNPHGQQWVDNGEVVVDVGITNLSPQIKWSIQPPDMPTALDFFDLSFPMDCISKVSLKLPTNCFLRRSSKRGLLTMILQEALTRH